MGKKGQAVERLRAAIATRIDAVGLRPVAREVGMDPKGITKFLNGSVPRTATRQKLERWYVQQLIQGDDAADAASARAAVRVLVQDLAPVYRNEATKEMVVFLVTTFTKFETPLPTWLQELQEPT